MEASGDKLPKHIAIIMDGNGRWARRRLLNRINGHRKGIEAVRETVSCCREMGVKYLTLYTFSKENWKRPAEEVSLLMMLLETQLKGELKGMLENNIRFRAIGGVLDLPPSVRAVVEEIERATSGNNGMLLQLALSYGGRDEIVNAARRAAHLAAEGVISPEDITEESFAGWLQTAGVPDPDLLIRTSGEMRLSNFLLWQLAYTEIVVTDVLWPDFTRRHLKEAIVEYQMRDRRFGRVKEKGALEAV